MEQTRVKDLMVPISEYAAVRVGTTMLDAIIALERAQEAYTTSKYQHRAILVLDDDNTVVGKIGQLRVLKAVENRDGLDTEMENLNRFGFSSEYIAGRREHSRLKGSVLSEESLSAAAEKKVEDFMQQPTPGEFVPEDCSMDIAIHRLVLVFYFSQSTHGV